MLLANKKETQEHQRTLRQNKYTLEQAYRLGKMLEKVGLLDENGYAPAAFVDKEGLVRMFSAEVLFAHVLSSVLKHGDVLKENLNFEQQLSLNRSLKEAVDKTKLYASEGAELTYMTHDTFIFCSLGYIYKTTRLIRRSIILSWFILAQMIYSLYMIVVFNYHAAAIELLDTAALFDADGATHHFIENITPFSLLIAYIAGAIIAAISFILVKRNLAPVIQDRNNFFVLFNHMPEKDVTDAFDRITNALSSKIELDEEILK